MIKDTASASVAIALGWLADGLPEMTRYGAFDFGTGALALGVGQVCRGFLLMIRTVLSCAKQNNEWQSFCS